jgi:hypothetical protein
LAGSASFILHNRRPKYSAMSRPGRLSRSKGATGLNFGVEEISYADLAGLVSLDLSNRNISSLSGLEFAYNLQELDLSKNDIWSVFGLRGNQPQCWQSGWMQAGQASFRRLKEIQGQSISLRPRWIWPLGNCWGKLLMRATEFRNRLMKTPCLMRQNAFTELSVNEIQFFSKQTSLYSSTQSLTFWR